MDPLLAAFEERPANLVTDKCMLIIQSINVSLDGN